MRSSACRACASAARSASRNSSTPRRRCLVRLAPRTQLPQPTCNPGRSPPRRLLPAQARALTQRSLAWRRLRRARPAQRAALLGVAADLLRGHALLRRGAAALFIALGFATARTGRRVLTRGRIVRRLERPMLRRHRAERLLTPARPHEPVHPLPRRPRSTSEHAAPARHRPAAD